jgi:hypothetical protein
MITLLSAETGSLLMVTLFLGMFAFVPFIILFTVTAVLYNIGKKKEGKVSLKILIAYSLVCIGAYLWMVFTM